MEISATQGIATAVCTVIGTIGLAWIKSLSERGKIEVGERQNQFGRLEAILKRNEAEIARLTERVEVLQKGVDECEAEKRQQRNESDTELRILRKANDELQRAIDIMRKK